MMSVESRTASSLVQYFEHLKPVDESEVLVIPMKVYNLVLGLPWKETRKSTSATVNWQPCERQNGPQWVKIPEADRTSPLPELGEVTKILSPLRVYNDSGLPHSIISQLVRKWSRHSPYDLENVKGSWEHRWKASRNVRETPGCWTCEQEQRQ